eukprot:6584278-Heterocapsa_arctica.AAC.1
MHAVALLAPAKLALACCLPPPRATSGIAGRGKVRAGAGMAAAGPRLGRENVLAEGDREVVVAEMTKELETKGSLYSWYELQFWRL